MPSAQPIDPGSLRHRVQIQQLSSTADSFGQPIESWSTVRTTSASIVSISQREVYQAGQFASQLTHVIVVRWSSVSIMPGMRVTFGSHIYKVQVVDNIEERNVFVKLLCLELGAQS